MFEDVSFIWQTYNLEHVNDALLMYVYQPLSYTATLMSTCKYIDI